MSHVGHELHPTVCAQEVGLAFKVPLPADELHGRIDAFISALTSSLRDDGCQLIGHIKGLLEFEENEHLFFSVTSFEEKASYKGELPHEISKAKLTINVIVYGVEQESVERAIREGFKRHVMTEGPE
jgi:hypothetical protein